MKYLIVNPYFLGDILFSTSIAKKLKEENPENEISFHIRFLQVLDLLKQNPYIHNVYVSPLGLELYPAWSGKIIRLPPVDQFIPATIGFQRAAGIQNPSTEYQVYTLPGMDEEAKLKIEKLRQQHNQPIIAWQSNWKERAYNTRESMLLENPKRGGPHRDIDSIIAQLEDHFCMVEVGLPNGMNSTDPRAQDHLAYAYTASFIKHCDWFIGSEGGLSNLAAGVGTKCIITTDFIHQVYGKYGFVRQIEHPQMGPAIYFPNAGHVHLEPWISDEEVAQQIIEIIKK